MALAPPPLRERLRVNVETQGRLAGSLYRQPDGQGGNSLQGGNAQAGSGEQDAWLLVGNNLAWSKWLQDLWLFVNQSADTVISITCGSDTHSLRDWICGLWDDDQALQAAVLAIENRINSIACGSFDFDLETWICGFSNALENVTVTICGTPFTQTLTDALQGIIDNMFFDIGSGCFPVSDYISDIYSILNSIPGAFMPIDGNGSGYVPVGEGIYSVGGGATEPKAMKLEASGVGFYDLVIGFIGGFGLSSLVTPGNTNLFLVANDGITTVSYQVYVETGAVPGFNLLAIV